ncbi:hypothetical protein Hanom_Chr04g00371901 [Helianthus anomalus]
MTYLVFLNTQQVVCQVRFCTVHLLGVVCFFRGKTSAVCEPHLQTSVAEKVNQTSSVCNKKTVCFLTSTSC